MYSLRDGMDIMQDSAGDSASFLHSIPLPCELYGQSRYSTVIVFGCNNPQSCDATRPLCGAWTGDAWGGTPTGTPPGSLSPPSAPRPPPTSTLGQGWVGGRWYGGSDRAAAGSDHDLAVRSRKRERID